MRPFLKRGLALVAFASCLMSAPARADIAPPDICYRENAACDNAGPSGDLPGICSPSTCSRPEPKPDGGVIITDCLRCLPDSSDGDDGGCSCRLSSGGVERAVAATMLLVGLIAYRAWRRRQGRES